MSGCRDCREAQSSGQEKEIAPHGDPGPEGGDPASVGFDAVKRGVEEGVDVVLVDTAGRLHTKSGLMDELGKVKRVVEKQAPVTEVLLVIDATTGQNGLTQARVFGEVVDVSGARISIRVPRDETAVITTRLLSEHAVLDLTVQDPPIEDVIELAFASGSLAPTDDLR